MSEQGADVLIDAGGGNVITLLDVELGELHAADFLFQPPILRASRPVF